jgi:drug/metabolite transporter (DMT)-like permease
VAPAVIGLAVLNATLCTFLPVLMVMLAIERVGAGVTSQVGMIGPLSTIAMSMLLLGEPFTWWMAVGTVLVLTGIWILTRSRT